MANEEFLGASEVTGVNNYRNNKASEPFRVVSVSSLTLSLFRLSLEEYENDGPLVSLFNTIESRRGVLLEILGGGVPTGSPNPDSISDQNMSFFTPVFRPGL